MFFLCHLQYFWGFSPYIHIQTIDFFIFCHDSFYTIHSSMVYIWWMPCFPLSNPILATISTLPIQNRGTVLDPELLDCSVCIYFIISAIDCNKLDERCCICIWLHLPIVFFLHFCEFYLVYLFLLYLTCNYIWYYLVLLVVAVVFVVVIRSKNTTITTTTTTTTTKTTNTNTTATTTTCHYFIEYCSYYSSAYKILYFKCFLQYL